MSENIVSTHQGAIDLNDVRRLAQDGVGSDEAGRRSEFLGLIDEAQRLASKPPER